MRSITSNNKFLATIAFVFTLFSTTKLHATNLSLGADYFVRGVAITERDNAFNAGRYYDQRLQGYLTTDLSKEVEATIRVQSITPWGLEGSTTPLVTRYPNANGNFWVQNAFVRLPNIWNNRIIITAGRQPLQWGDGKILADGDLGFNAIRAQIKSPFRRLPFDLDGFTAKIAEGLNTPAGDTDLHGALLGFDSKSLHWELTGLWENSSGDQNYEMGSETSPVVTSKLKRTIYGVRAITRLKDAYLKGEYYLQDGSGFRGTQKIKLGGSAYVVGLGGKQSTAKFGRFGAILEVTEGSGDDSDTADTDEAFRPTFASRWSGLERKGLGRYFASTFSDAYSPSAPFAPASSTNTGLPPGASGIQAFHFGMESTPWSQWTFSLDYFQYKAQKNIGGNKELGTEFDYGFVYRYSGLVTVQGTTSAFNPGQAFSQDTKRNAQFSSLEIAVKF